MSRNADAAVQNLYRILETKMGNTLLRHMVIKSLDILIIGNII